MRGISDMRHLVTTTSLLALTAAAALGSASSALAAAAESTEVQAVIVTGTRTTGLKAADSAAPIEVVGGDARRRSASRT